MANNIDPTKEIISSPESAINETRQNIDVVDATKSGGLINFEWITEVSKTIRHVSSLINDNFLNFLIGIAIVYVVFVGIYIHSGIDYSLLFIIANLFFLLVISIAYIVKSKAKSQNYKGEIKRFPKSDKKSLQTYTEDESEYKFFQQKYEEVRNNTLGDFGFQRQLNKEMIIAFLTKNTTRIQRSELVTSNLSARRINEIMINNIFFEEISEFGKQFISIKNEWKSIIPIAAIWLTHTNGIDDKSTKKIFFPKKPFLIDGNLWDYPYDQVLFFTVQICNKETINRNIIEFLEESRRNRNPQQHKALLLASKIAELRADALAPYTVRELIKELQNNSKISRSNNNI